MIIFYTPVELTLQRIQKRGILPNCYHGLGIEEIREAVLRGLHINDIAANALKARGIRLVPVKAGGDVNEVADTLHTIIPAQISSFKQAH